MCCCVSDICDSPKQDEEGGNDPQHRVEEAQHEGSQDTHAVGFDIAVCRGVAKFTG